ASAADELCSVVRSWRSGSPMCAAFLFSPAALQFLLQHRADLLMRSACLLTLFLFAAAGAQEVVDRMVAVVNRRVILDSELEQAARVEQLLQGKPAEKASAQELQAVLDRMIDRALLEQQIAKSAPLDPSSEELDAQVKEIRDKIPGAASEE